MPALVWFRRDLRLGDNPAWSAATLADEQVTALFVVDPGLWDRVAPRRRAMLAGHLAALDRTLVDLGGRLRVERGDPAEVVPRVAGEIGSGEVHANADVTPFASRRDDAVAKAIAVEWHHGSLVHPPGSVVTKEGRTYTVFTPFHRAWSERPVDPTPAPGAARVAAHPGTGVPDAGPPPLEPGETAALDRLDGFLDRVDRYPAERNRPDLDTTSRLSIDLKWGTVGPRTVLEQVGEATEGRSAFVRQLAWRDFYAHVMAAMPHTVDRAMKPAYDRVSWVDDPEGFEAWKAGRTGYPIVDAGMRQLAAEGWMHNRVRMITASFLVKDLLVDWRLGERHFRRHLLDGDVSQNVGNWQWTTGSGADAAPYFRVFNPVGQSKKFDPDGDYVRRWVPELAAVVSPAIHAPWEAPPLELAEAGVVLGDSYPWPIVDHAEARERALAAYRSALEA
jgi:deoxyribodipyrimidine photo-lyase